MNSETSPNASEHGAGRVGKTLQAILLSKDGAMDSIAVPVPLPDVVIRVQSGDPRSPSEVHFWRARSADSVVRFVEEEGEPGHTSDAEKVGSGRQCARCGNVRAVYFVPKLARSEPLTPQTAVYCDECYGAATG